MFRKILALALVAGALATGGIAGQAIPGSSCSASNEAGGTCSITCPDGKSAVCHNATGANTPSCSCQ